MSEWWTYRLHDFLLFSPRTYFRLFELYNRDIWPLQLPILLAGAASLVLLIRRRHDRVVAATIAFAWLWVAWAFHLKYYSTINWAATWFGAAFVIEALLMIWVGVIRNHLQTEGRDGPEQRIGLAIFAFALAIEPLLELWGGRSWREVALFGTAPDPTTVGTLGILLFAGRRVRTFLLVVPLLWCAISGATLRAIGAKDSIVLPLTALLVLALMIREGVRSRHLPRRGERAT